MFLGCLIVLFTVEILVHSYLMDFRLSSFRSNFLLWAILDLFAIYWVRSFLLVEILTHWLLYYVTACFVIFKIPIGRIVSGFMQLRLVCNVGAARIS